MTPKEQNKKSLDGLRSLPQLYKASKADIDAIESHLTSSNIAILRSVLEWAEWEKKIEIEEKNSGDVVSNDITFGYNQALTDLKTHITQQIKELE